MKKIFSRSLFIFLSSFLLVTCEKEEVTPRDYPRVTTYEVSNISSAGAVFQAEITYPGNGPITDHGFVWGTETGGNLNSAEIKSLGPKAGKGAFSATVATAMEKGETQYVRAYAIGNGYTVYGKEVSFVSLGSQAPEIAGFSPGTGTWGDTIQITGAGFSFLQRNNKVNFGDSPAKVLAANDSVVTCLVPDDILDKSVKIRVTVAGNSSFAENSFQLITPEVTDFHPAKGTFGDIITISGRDFRAGSVVKFADYDAEVISTTSHEIKVRVPDELDQSEAKITVILNTQEHETNNSFQLLPPEITSLAGSTEYIGNTITVSGNNFSPIVTNNKVFFEENEARIVRASVNELQVEVPDGSYSQRKCKITVQVAGQKTTSHDEFELADAWYRKKTENESLLKSDFFGGVKVGTKGYFMSYKNFTFLEYDPSSNKLEEKAALPFNSRGPYEVVILPVENTLFYGYFRNYEDYGLFKYNETQNIWSQTIPYPERVELIVSFSIGDKGFVGFGRDDNRLWEYDLLENKYVERDSFPGRLGGISFAIDGKGYVGNRYQEFWQYDPEKDQWTSRSPVPKEISESKSVFIYDNKAYSMYSDALYQYDPIEDNWTKIDLPNFRGEAPCVIGEYVYFLYSGYIWELDPKRL